jgi:hypothetical protein
MVKRDVGFALDELLHPARAYGHPNQVLLDPDLTLNEKRAILASWASDACAVEADPHVRSGPRGPVRFDDIMDALRELDRQGGEAFNPKYRKLVRQERVLSKRTPDRGDSRLD